VIWWDLIQIDVARCFIRPWKYFTLSTDGPHRINVHTPGIPQLMGKPGQDGPLLKPLLKQNQIE
jgi:hypothetical protein